jgi:predicted DNA-binding transcriptional regulator YafY
MKKVQPDKIQRELIKAIRTSANGKKLLNISYTDSKGVATVRLIEPYEIRNGTLFGFCHKANSIRRFVMNQITQAQVSNIGFVPKFNFLI